MIQIHDDDWKRILALRDRAAQFSGRLGTEVVVELSSIEHNVRQLMKERGVPLPVIAIDPKTVPTQDEIRAMVIAGRNG